MTDWIASRRRGAGLRLALLGTAYLLVAILLARCVALPDLSPDPSPDLSLDEHQDSCAGSRCFGIEWRSVMPDNLAALLDDSYGAMVMQRDGSGRTPLHWAVQYSGDPAVVELLLAAGSDANAVDLFAETALHLAAEQATENYAMPELLTLLLVAGGDPNARSAISGDTPLHRAATFAIHPDSIERLLEYGADPSLRDWNGNLPLAYAAQNRYLLHTVAIERLRPRDESRDESRDEKGDEK